MQMCIRTYVHARNQIQKITIWKKKCAGNTIFLLAIYGFQ